MKSLLDQNGLQLQFAGHETFPPKYGWFKKSFDAVRQLEGANEVETKSIFASGDAISKFGVGRNMVLAMRHWALACGVLKPVGDTRNPDYVTTSVGRSMFEDDGCDPYLEQPASLWLLHWNLARAPGRATVWYYAFSEFNEAIFNRETLRNRILARIDAIPGAKRPADVTLTRDVECFMRTYVRKRGARAGEDALESPFAELGLISWVDVGSAAQFRRGPKPTLGDDVFAHALMEFWRQRYPSRRHLSIETVASEPGSPGRVFLLDEDSVAERLERIDAATSGQVWWDESSGLRQIACRDPEAVDPLGLRNDAIVQLEVAE
ncbi:DUF4007 family protein [Sphingomonas sp. 2R-10]|uniref:DUF4007 family protein n=1 Tax=Sphingomonas sp. 2R-10 TaxID=3045148 RepID=UPI0013DE39D6|nr:DUF4007 family protein [Sphingomonas sp. 2R-10]MDJ0275407.1 DUF4007 family protein [Sphingomonas sp. 2R-10]